MDKKIFYLLFSVFVLIADQLSKWAVTEAVIRPALNAQSENVSTDTVMPFFTWLLSAPPRLPFHSIEIWPFFNLVMVWNDGISFGMFKNPEGWGYLILIALSAIVSIWFLIWLFNTRSTLQKWGIALVIGGAVGNMIDRVRFRGVVDFLDFHVFGWHYPAFNIADSAIVLGVFILLYYALFMEKRTL